MASIEQQQEHFKRIVEQCRRDALSAQEKARADLTSLLNTHEKFKKTRITKGEGGNSSTDEQDLDKQISESLNAKAAAYNSEWKICMLNYLALLSTAFTFVRNSAAELYYSQRVGSADNKLKNNAELVNAAKALTFEQLMDTAVVQKGELKLSSQHLGGATHYLIDKTPLGSDFKASIKSWLTSEHDCVLQNDKIISNKTGQPLEASEFNQYKETLHEASRSAAPAP